MWDVGEPSSHVPHLRMNYPFGPVMGQRRGSSNVNISWCMCVEISCFSFKSAEYYRRPSSNDGSCKH